MGREIRRVPQDWQHPKDASGRYIPMHKEFVYTDNEVAEGLRDGWLDADDPDYGVPVMPQWPEEERTHLMMYETCTEGTPISPAFATPEELARWLTDTGASAFGSMTATYEQWLATCRRGWAVSAVGVPGKGIVSGVEASATDGEGGAS